MPEEITKEVFLSLTNDQAWDLFTKARSASATMEQLNVKMDFLLTKVEKMESEISMYKAVNVALKKDVTNLRKRLNADSQYHRQDNIELVGKPDNVNDSDLEATVVKILKKTGVNVQQNEIVDCHRLRNRKKVIMRFVNRKYANQALLNAKKLKGNTRDILNDDTQIYINRNLIPEYANLRWKAQKLRTANYLHAVGVNKRGVYVKASEHSAKQQIEVEEDLICFLPEGKKFSGF